MENSDPRIAPAPEAASDDFAFPSNPATRDGRDRPDFDPVPLRHRVDGFTPEKQRAYVEALADCGVAREAAARIGLSEQAIARVRRRADAVSFDRACEAAHLFGARRLRSIAFERAIEGTVKGRYYRGELIAEERVYDNRLLIYLLGQTARLLEPDEAASRSVCANWEAHMDALEKGLPPPAAVSVADPPDHGFEIEQVWEAEAGLWRTSFPPPAGFQGEENRVWNDRDWYERSLSPQEEAVMEARCDEEDAESLADAAARRDRFFGFKGGISSSLEAETYETSEPSEPARGPIEHKSLYPPCAGAPNIHADARRRGGAVLGPGRRSASRDDPPPRETVFRGSATMRRTFPPPRAFPR